MLIPIVTNMAIYEYIFGVSTCSTYRYTPTLVVSLPKVVIYMYMC